VNQQQIGSVGRSIVDHSLTRLDHCIEQTLAKAWPSLLFVFALQAKIIWGSWWWRDMTIGDTSSYFGSAYRWAQSFQTNVLWSPLYTAFYGSLYWLTGDAYSATIWHRIIIVLVASLGVLAVARRLLPPAWALAMAIWWTVVPINFETLYEVHLFALLPILAAWVIAARDTMWARGWALGILLACTILTRNELLVAALLFGTICLIREIKAFRQNRLPLRNLPAHLMRPYGVPLLVSFAVCAFFFWRAGWDSYLAEARGKHTLNMCQVYAFGYGQRHPEWTLNPWIECSKLMQSTFGQPFPSLMEMIRNNWQAVIDHFLWNVSLTPNGLQVALFNAMSGRVNPDYPPVNHSWTALASSLASLALLAAGGIALARHWRYWWTTWFARRAGLWLIMLSVMAISVPIILTQRPRPSYLFSTTLVLMAAISTSAYVLTYRWPSLVNRAVIAMSLMVLFTIPLYYRKHQSDRPLYQEYENLKPYASAIIHEGNFIVLGNHYSTLRDYLGYPDVGTKVSAYDALKTWDRTEEFGQYLSNSGISVIYLEPWFLTQLRQTPAAARLLQCPQSVGWKRVGPSQPDQPSWLLLARLPTGARSPSPSSPASCTGAP
jgi:hypothetical protein